MIYKKISFEFCNQSFICEYLAAENCLYLPIIHYKFYFFQMNIILSAKIGARNVTLALLGPRGLNYLPLIQFDENFLESVYHSIPYSLKNNENVLENNNIVFLTKSTFWQEFGYIFFTYPQNHEGSDTAPSPTKNIYLLFLF